MQSATDNETAKIAAAKAAVDCIEEGMLVGLGTGSTATYFIEALITRVKETGLKIEAVATSSRSYEQAAAGGIPLLDVNDITRLDITVDGADEVDHQKRMIKGGGGALLREKIIASISREMVVIIDETKLVKHLGKFPLPVEITQFASKAIIKQIHNHGFQGELRRNKQGTLYTTDNGNYIIDIHLRYPCNEPERDHLTLNNIPGVVETGFFFNLAGRIFVGHPNGNVDIIH